MNRIRFDISDQLNFIQILNSKYDKLFDKKIN